MLLLPASLQLRPNFALDSALRAQINNFALGGALRAQTYRQCNLAFETSKRRLRGSLQTKAMADGSAQVMFDVRPDKMPFVLGCVAAAVAAASAAAGAQAAAIAWILTAIALERVSRRSVPRPEDIVRFAAPESFLAESNLAPFANADRIIEPKHVSDDIQDLMRSQLAAGTQIGMAVSVYYKGQEVAHVCGGVYRSMGGARDEWKAVDPNTLFMSYSVCKGVAATGLMTCVDRGECSYLDTVSALWPEFKRGGKGNVTIADAISHRAGMPGLKPSFLAVVAAHILALARGWQSAWQSGLRFIENYTPEWVPGTSAQYHYVSFSWIIGGIVERVSRMHISDVTHDRIARPLGQQDKMFIGLLPPADAPRAARLEVCLPSSNGFFSAGALGRMYGALTNAGAVGEQRLVSASTLAQVIKSWQDAVPTRGTVRPGKSEMARLALGFSPWVDARVGAPPDQVCTLSHFGMGSCIAFGEVETGLSIAILKNSYEPVALVGGSLSPDVCEMVHTIKRSLGLLPPP